MFRISRFFLFCLNVLAVMLVMGIGSRAINAQEVTPMPTISLATLHTRDLQIDLGDGWTSSAQFTWPAEGAGPFPTVILFPPSGPQDMDVTQQYTANGPIVAQNFRMIAQQLGLKGIAVLRFDKRGVRNNAVADNAQAGKSAPRGREVADGESVIAAVLEQPEVDAKHLYLFGWSDGTMTATQLAVFHPELAGLILQGAPNFSSLKEGLAYQMLQESVGYYQSALDANKDGKLSPEELQKLPAYGIAAWISGSFYDSTSTPDHPVLTSALDTNGDGLIDIQSELVPYLQSQIETIAANNPDQNVPMTADVLARLQVPVLLLQGRNDGAVPYIDAETIAQALGSRATLKIYPGLGHGLDPVSNPALDDFGAISQQPIDDMIAWILAQK